MTLRYPDSLNSTWNLFTMDELLRVDDPIESEEQARLLRNASPGTRISTLSRKCAPGRWPPCCGTISQPPTGE